MKTKCMIVDDEPLARELISGYVSKIDQLELVQCCSNAMEAFQILKTKKIDLVFLDINMPQMTGIDFLRSLKNPPKVIIITAYKEYALEGFELDVIDYLLKPVSFSRLLKAVDKYFMTSDQKTLLNNTDNNNIEDFIYLKENKKVIKVLINDIDYIEAMGEYCQVYAGERRIIPKMSIKSLEELFAEKSFIRIHKSFVVPLKRISAFSASSIEINREKELPIGRSYKNAVFHALQYHEKLQDI